MKIRLQRYFLILWKKNEGVLFDVIHTGTKPDDVFIDGTVKGAGKVRKVKNPYKSLAGHTASIIFIILFPSLVINGIITPEILQTLELKKGILSGIISIFDLIVVIVIIGLAIGGLLYYHEVRKPETQRKYKESILE